MSTLQYEFLIFLQVFVGKSSVDPIMCFTGACQIGEGQVNIHEGRALICAIECAPFLLFHVYYVFRPDVNLILEFLFARLEYFSNTRLA